MAFHFHKPKGRFVNIHLQSVDVSIGDKVCIAVFELSAEKIGSVVADSKFGADKIERSIYYRAYLSPFAIFEKEGVVENVCGLEIDASK